jgi:membrane protein
VGRQVKEKVMDVMGKTLKGKPTDEEAGKTNPASLLFKGLLGKYPGWRGRIVQQTTSPGHANRFGLARKNILADFTAWVWREPKRLDQKIWWPARSLCRILFIVGRESKKDKITLRASALTFTVILSLVPMLALGTAVLKGLGYGDQMRQAAYRLMEPPTIPLEPASQPTPGHADLAGIETLSSSGDSDAVPQADEQTAESSLSGHISRAIDQIFDYVDRTDFAALGTFGVLGLVLAALAVLDSIEQSMNSIWQVDMGRPMGRKLIDYMALMFLLPVTVNLALATEATLQSPALLNQLHNLIPIVQLGKFLLNVLPLSALVLTFTLLYRFLPNTMVTFPAALIGGLVGAVCWLLTQTLYLKLQIGVARYNAIYGSFATLPLFLLWIYVAWMVFLMGAEVAFATQQRRHYVWRQLSLTPIVRLSLALEVMEAVLADFRARRISTRSSLATSLEQPESTIAPIINELVQGDKLRLVTGIEEGYGPAAPEDEIRPAELVDLIFGAKVPAGRHSGLAQLALDAARQALNGQPIASVHHQVSPAAPEEEISP